MNLADLDLPVSPSADMVHGREGLLVQGNPDVDQGVDVDQRLAQVDFREGPHEWNVLLVDGHVLVQDGDQQAVASVDGQLLDHFQGNIGPQGAKADIQDIDRAHRRIALKARFDHWQGHQTVHWSFLAQVCKSHLSAGQHGPIVGVDVPPVESIAFLGVWQAVLVFVDHPDGFNPFILVDMGQSPVVWSDDVVAGLGLDGN